MKLVGICIMLLTLVGCRGSFNSIDDVKCYSGGVVIFEGQYQSNSFDDGFKFTDSGGNVTYVTGDCVIK
jgi:hypothetical protein